MSMIRIAEGAKRSEYREPDPQDIREDAPVGLMAFYQIPWPLKLRLGWRESRFLENGIVARITAGQTVYIEILLDRATDLYRISTYKLRNGIRKDRQVWDQVCVEQMITILDLLDRGELEA